ncbi:unnamed protein product [Mytilus coruscus]|uniref:Uncharacterized protein n=1 Tax=Mytilus coruscus TaxID=42192 RepID=A0A6J8E149_MYTCO|nr:unnamed protein product [Mytilus coruscus]
MPSSIVNKPPVLEGTTIYNVIGKHLVDLHKARKAFIAAESSAKFRRALCKQISPSGGKIKKCQNGSLNGKDSPDTDDGDSLDLENQADNDIHEENMEHDVESQGNDCVKSKKGQMKKKEILLKLHKQFGHASSDKLLSLLQSAGSVDSETKTILKDICTKCLIGHKFQYQNAKQVVAFSHANDFNHIVIMDLHEIEQYRGKYVRVHQSRIKRDIENERKQKFKRKDAAKSTPVRNIQAATYNHNIESDVHQDLMNYESDEQEPHHNDTDNDESQENVEGYAYERVAGSSDIVDSHVGNNVADGSHNGEDSHDMKDGESLD